MKNQYHMYPFRPTITPQNSHGLGRIALPRRYSHEMVNKVPMIPTMRTITPPPGFPSHHQGMGIVPGMWSQHGQPMAYAQSASGYGYVPVGIQYQAQPYSPMSSRSVSPISSRTMSPIPVATHHSHPLDYQPIELRSPHHIDMENSSFSTSGANLSIPAPNESARPFSVDTLCIGSWRRMALNPSDLRCYYNIPDRQMSWHISDLTSHFKMEFSFEAITSLEFVMMDGIFAQIYVELNESPVFYMENNKERLTNDGKASNPTWTQCSDFTEGKQASRFFKHSMKGLAHPLMQQISEITAADNTMRKVTKIMDQTHASPVHKPALPSHLNYQRRHSYDNFRYMPMMSRPAPSPSHANQSNGRRAASVPDVKAMVCSNTPLAPPMTEITPATPTNVEFSSGMHMNASAASLSTYRTARGPHGTSPLSHVSAVDNEDTDTYSDMSASSTPLVMYQDDTQPMEMQVNPQMQMWAAYGEQPVMMESTMEDSMMMPPPMMHPSDHAGMGMAPEYEYVEGGYYTTINGQEQRVVIGEDGTHYLEN
ncbi:hypothetical protein BC936DRAFT_139285 [Jimgerdemannia flammicorona]|uniref:TRF2/HOY1 PH-like domain-containing protein n=2 Tax=Jimgerdemannia flammicorona TaxID=994334 RepID=A0A433BA79_9FUNG|nr:hypothetical protein BC936DRAFT_139285 [Jimgerdemannia flammicorona]RUS25172.1 hypothetical protein BC938DRAFT_472529 [Jimgerdemannia flammicorona]